MLQRIGVKNRDTHKGGAHPSKNVGKTLFIKAVSALRMAFFFHSPFTFHDSQEAAPIFP